MALYWSLGILFTSSTLLSQLFFVFANKYDVATVCFYVCPKFSLFLQKKCDLQFVFMSVPRFLFLQKNMLFLQFLLMSVPRFLYFCKKYVVFAIFSYVCPKFLKRHIMFMWFALYLYCTGKYFSINTQQLLLSSENSRSNSKLDTRKMFHPLLGARCRRVTFSLSFPFPPYSDKEKWLNRKSKKKEARFMSSLSQIIFIEFSRCVNV